MLNFTTSTLFNIYGFIYDIIFPLFMNHILEGIAIIILIHLASKASKILDTTAKVVAIAAGSTILYNNWAKPSSSGSSSGESDENKNNKNKNKQNQNKKGTNAK